MRTENADELTHILVNQISEDPDDHNHCIC